MNNREAYFLNRNPYDVLLSLQDYISKQVFCGGACIIEAFTKKTYVCPDDGDCLACLQKWLNEETYASEYLETRGHINIEHKEYEK